MKRLLIIALLSVGFAACGGDDSVSTEDANQIAADLAQKTQSLSDDVADAGRTLADDPDAVDATRNRLNELADQARDQAGKADDLPESEDARSALREANDRIAEAADELANADSSHATRDKARQRLEEAGDRIGDAVDQLADELPPDARKKLDDLREQLSSATP